MIKNLIIYIGLLIVAVSFSDCSVQKRIYQDGFYVSRHKKAVAVAKPQNKTESKQMAAQPEIIETIVVKSNESSNNPVSASTNNVLSHSLFEKKAKPIIFNGDTCGDKILLRNGELKIAKIIEVSSKTVKYKLCDNLNGPLFVIGTDKIELVTYTNGLKETFEAAQIEPTPPTYTPNKNEDVYTRNQQVVPKQQLKYHNMAVAAFICGFFFWLLIPGILSIIFGIIGLVKIKNEPNKYRGEFLAAFWLCIFAFVLLLALLLSVA